MAFDRTTIEAILKTVYIGPVRDQLNNATVLLSQLIKKKRKYVGGKEAYFPLRKGRNVGIGARPEDTAAAGAAAALPEPGNQQYDKSIYRVVFDYAGIKITGPAMSHSKSDEGSFLRGLQSEMEGAIVDKKVDSNRMAWHDGSSVLTGCGVTGGSTTVVVLSTKFLEVGMQVDIRTISTGAIITNGQQTILTIPTATTFTVALAVTTAATDAVYRRDSRFPAGASWGKAVEPWGLEALVSDANPGNGLTDLVGDITRTGNTWWQARVLGNGGVLRPLSLDLMQQAFDETDIASDFLPGLIQTSYAGKREYAKFLVPDKRYPAGGEITLDGGYKGLEFNGVALVADRDASQTLNPAKCERMYFLTLSSMMFFENEPWGWMDEDGAVLSRVLRRDSYEAFLKGYYNIIVLHPNRNALLKDLEGV